MPIRFQHFKVKGFRSPAPYWVIKRRSRFGNPFPVPSDQRHDQAAHSEAVAKYRAWITAPEQSKLLADARRELRGRNLGCSCPLDLPCHADVLLELVNQV
jgi:hypothetical protein